MPVTLQQINTLPINPTKDWPTHLQDHSIIAQALQQYVPLVINHQEAIQALAPMANPTFTGVVALSSMKFGTSTNVGQVLTASNATGGVAWADPAVASVAGKTGQIALEVADVAGAAPIDNPSFQGTVSTQTLTVSGAEEPKVGQVLTAANTGGEAQWADVIARGATPPTADEDHRGALFFVEGAPGTADELRICIRETSGQYAWKKLTTA